jgi:hypothetical protein
MKLRVTNCFLRMYKQLALMFDERFKAAVMTPFTASRKTLRK